MHDIDERNPPINILNLFSRTSSTHHYFTRSFNFTTFLHKKFRLNKLGFHTIATIAVIAEKKKVQRSQRSYGNHFPAIAATTIAEIEKVLSQRSWKLGCFVVESGFHMIATVVELFFSQRSQRSYGNQAIYKRMRSLVLVQRYGASLFHFCVLLLVFLF